MTTRRVLTRSVYYAPRKAAGLQIHVPLTEAQWATLLENLEKLKPEIVERNPE